MANENDQKTLLSAISGLIDICSEQQQRIEALETALRRLPDFVPANRKPWAKEVVANLPEPVAGSGKSSTLQLLETAKEAIQSQFLSEVLQSAAEHQLATPCPITARLVVSEVPQVQYD